MMADDIRVEQNAPKSSQVTQVGVQYNGLEPQAACQMLINLFMDNFPKLQKIAQETARQRVDELCTNTIQEMVEEKMTDFTPFCDPGVQYTLYEAEKSYARYGTKDMLAMLSKLLVQRVSCNDDFILKVTTDHAIEIASRITVEQLDWMSLMFFTEEVEFRYICGVEELKKNLEWMCDTFNVDQSNVSLSYLNMLGCLSLSLPDPQKILSERYKLPIEEIEKVMPQRIKDLEGDYGLSSVGRLLAIINIQNKTKLKFNIKSWIC